MAAIYNITNEVIFISSVIGNAFKQFGNSILAVLAPNKFKVADAITTAQPASGSDAEAIYRYNSMVSPIIYNGKPSISLSSAKDQAKALLDKNKSSVSSSSSNVSSASSIPTSAQTLSVKTPSIDGLNYGNLMAPGFNMTSADAYQEALANTAHQREVQDLLAAGLNPVLSANGGNGAPVFSTSLPDYDTSGGSVSGTSAKKNATSSVLGKLVGAVASLAGARSSSAKALGTIAEYGLKLFE